jgi:hypothetical protein
VALRIMYTPLALFLQGGPGTPRACTWAAQTSASARAWPPGPQALAERDRGEHVHRRAAARGPARECGQERLGSGDEPRVRGRREDMHEVRARARACCPRTSPPATRSSSQRRGRARAERERRHGRRRRRHKRARGVQRAHARGGRARAEQGRKCEVAASCRRTSRTEDITYSMLKGAHVAASLK